MPPPSDPLLGLLRGALWTVYLLMLAVLASLLISLHQQVQAASDPALMDLARTVWAESRGEPVTGQLAVAFTVLNRLDRDPARWGRTVSQVVRKPSQFTVWSTPAKRRRLMALSDATPGFARAKDVAELALSRKAKDPTSGAVYFHSTKIHPRWARGLTGVRIGHHIFYRTGR
jgi:spore germination cell wall hydrolase CwlJ-like protein